MTKPWFKAKLRKLWSEKERAFRRGERDKFTESKYKFSKAIRDAKRQYSEKLQNQFSAINSATVWRGLRQIMNFRPTAPHSTNDLRLANQLNEFCCRLGVDLTPSPMTPLTRHSPGTPPTPPQKNPHRQQGLIRSSRPP